MHIEIAGRFRPFSHLPGTSFMLPKSSLAVQVFPTRLFIKCLENIELDTAAEISLDIKGPVEEFTVMQDLEKRHLRVWGRGVDGFFRFRIEVSPANDGVDFVIEKGQVVPEALVGVCTFLESPSEMRYRIFTSEKDLKLGVHPTQLERLSLGSHKSQNVDMLHQRPDFFEIIPLWYCLGRMVPQKYAEISEGTLRLLAACEKAIQEANPEDLLKAFHNLFMAGFDNWLVPRLFDTAFNGLIAPPTSTSRKVSALPLLSQGATLIKSLLLQYKDTAIKLLPALPVEFHCGRFLDVACGDVAILSMEWSKKAIRRVALQALKSGPITIVCSKGEQTCRLRTGNKDNGVTYQIGEPFDLIAGQNYWFDNFHR